MTRATVVLALATMLGSCAFAQKHPAVTAGIVAGTIGFSTCFLSVDKVGTCGLVGLGAGVVIGGITGIATTVFEPNAPSEPDEEALQRRRAEPPPPGPYLPPEPNPLPQSALPDAGVPAPLDANSADAPAAP